MPNSSAYWVAPNGKTIDVGTRTHIKYIIDNPKIFGLDKKYIIDKYAEYGEIIGVEGDARSEIMMDLMKKGWLRIRHIPRNDSWTIQTYYFGNKEKNNLWDWIREAYKKKWANAFADIRILITKSGRVIDSSFSELTKGKKIFERKFSMKLKEIMKNSLIETSLSRVWQHINDPNSSFAVISAYLDNDDDVLNHKNLAKNIRSFGKGYIELDSGYSYKTPDGDSFTSEKSYMIPNIDKNKAILLAKKYGQQSILWKNGSEFILLGTRNDVGVGKILMRFKTSGKSLTFDKSTVKAAFSALRKGSKKGKKFAFVAERRIFDFPTSYIYQNKDVDEWIYIL